MTDQELALSRRRRAICRQTRAAFRGVRFSAFVIGVVLSGALPMAAGTQTLLLSLAIVSGISRLMRGLWASWSWPTAWPSSGTSWPTPSCPPPCAGRWPRSWPGPRPSWRPCWGPWAS